MDDRRGSDPDALRAGLRGVRGFLLDLDGVIVLTGRPIPGAPEALRALEERGIPYRIVTNTSLVSRRTLSRLSADIGALVPPERFHSALSASAAYTARRHPGAPLYVLASTDALGEFAGQRLLSHEEAAEPGATAAAVVIGDSPEEITWANLNRAFRLVRNGAELIGMHKNRWWLTAEGPTLDSGAFVAGLEYATGQPAHVLGKPAAAFFRLAADEVAAEAAAIGGAGRPARDAIAMVGDDVWNDALAAQRVGLRGVLVLSGKHGPAELDRAARQGRGGGRPNAVAASLAEVVAALE